MAEHRCPCEDSNGDVCNKVMTNREWKQDGMCQRCADNVWHEMTQDTDHKWYHTKEKKDDKKK